MKNFQTVKLEDIKRPPKYIVTEEISYKTRMKGQRCVLRDKYSSIVKAVLNPCGTLTIRRGCRYDGPSGPGLDTPNAMDGSLAHDQLYDMLQEGRLLGDTKKLRKLADLTMRDINKIHGMGWFRRGYCYRAVRWGGRSSAKYRNS